MEFPQYWCRECEISYVGIQELLCKSLLQFAQYTFDRYLPFMSVHKVKVVLKQCEKTNQFQIEVYIRN